MDNFINNRFIYYEEWKCFQDELPKSNCGLLIKIIPNENSVTIYKDIVKNNLYYAYILPNSKYVYAVAKISNMEVSTISWKVSKEFGPDEIYWKYNWDFSSLKP